MYDAFGRVRFDHDEFDLSQDGDTNKIIREMTKQKQTEHDYL